MNTPNKLSVFRIFLVPFLVWVILTKLPARGEIGLLDDQSGTWQILAAVIFLIGVFTDFLDGFLARRNRQITKLGQLLDPVADKLLVSAALISLVELATVNAGIVVVILSREFAVNSMRSVAASEGWVIPASRLGKFKTASQMAAITLLILGEPILGRFLWVGKMMIWVAVVITVVSGLHYFYHFVRRFEGKLTT